MANTDLAIKIATTLDATGINKANKSIGNLSKNVSKLGRNLGLALSTTALVAYGKSSIRAAAEAQGQQERLAKLLKITVGASNAQIASLNSQATALEKIGVVSAGNITQTQSQLATFNLQKDTIEKLTPAILDYVTAEKGASATTDQFKQMTNGLAQALNGNFASLTKTGFVIDDNTKSIIKNGTEAQRTQAIVDVLDSTYKGFNQSLRDTPVGQLAVLNNAANQAKETIGQGLIDALVMLGGDGTNQVESVSNAMASFAQYTADTIRGIGVLTNKIGSLDRAVGGGLLGKLLALNSKLGFTGLLSRLGADSQPRPRASRSFGGSSIQGTIYNPAAAKRAKEQSALAAKQVKATKALTAEQKKQNTLKKAGSIFDLEQVELIAALKGKLSDEDRKRVELQFALITGNTKQAQQLTYELAKAQGLGEKIAKYLADLPQAANPFASWEAYLDMLMKKAQKVAMVTPATFGTTGSLGNPNFETGTTAQIVSELDKSTAYILQLVKETDALVASIAGSSASNPAALTALKNLNTNQSSGQFGLGGDFAGGTRVAAGSVIVQIDGKAVASALQDSSLSGIGSSVDRTYGSFGSR